jgi:predicted DsbA family dithiol-disulfide isomerase
MTTSRKKLTLDIVLDVVCPWCYIGFRGLDWARMALSFDYTLDVRFRPYRLDPECPPEGRDHESTLARKFPDPAVRLASKKALVDAMQDVGLSFDPETPSRLPDTTDSHRLIRWAAEEGLAHEVVAGLFEAYWQHGEDVSRPDVLAQIASAAGLDEDEIRQRLATSEDRDAVRQEAAELRGGGLAGVPGFIINEAAGFEGALPKADLLAAIRQMAEETVAPD